MNADLKYAILLAASFLALFGFAEYLYHVQKVRAEYTRKIVHIGTGLLTFLFPVLLSSHWWVLALCASFAVILIASLKLKFLPSINAVDRDTVGSLCYPVAVYTCFYASAHYNELVMFYLPILLLAICDPIAALTGRRWPWGKYAIMGQHKTLMGTGAFVFSAIVLTALFYQYSLVSQTGATFGWIVLIAFASAGVEALSARGWDNLTIPWTVLLIQIVIR